MKIKDPYLILKVRKRPWSIWLLRIVWFVWLIFWAEVALGSWKEGEPRAFSITLVVFLISLILGILLWLWRYKKFKKA